MACANFAFHSKLLGVCAVLFVASFWGSRAVSAQEAARWKLQPGEKYTVQFDQTTTTLSTAAKKTKKSTSEMSLWVQWTIAEATATNLPAGLTELPAESVLVTQQVQRVRMQVTSESGEILYDSAQRSLPVGLAKEYANRLAPLLKPESQLVYVMNARGEMWQAKGAQPEGKGMAVTPFLQRPLLVLPVDAANKTWTQVSELPTPSGFAKHEMTYTLADAAAEPLTIALTGKLSLDKSEEKEGGKPTTIKSFTHTGELHFSAKEGLLLDSQQSTHLVTESPIREDKVIMDVSSQLSAKMTRQEPAAPATEEKPQ